MFLIVLILRGIYLSKKSVHLFFSREETPSFASFQFLGALLKRIQQTRSKLCLLGWILKPTDQNIIEPESERKVAFALVCTTETKALSLVPTLMKTNHFIFLNLEESSRINYCTLLNLQYILWH